MNIPLIFASFFQALASNPFLSYALFAGFAASVTSGIMGSFVVVKRIVFISGSIAHSVLGGMGLFLWLKRTYNLSFLNPIHGALLAALLSALLIGYVHLKYKEREDTIIAALWSTGMAIGVIFISLTPGYNVELMNFLFGNILWVSSSDIYTLLGLDVLIVAITAVFYRRFQAICFDENQAELQGISVRGLYFLLLCMIALSVVLLIQIVGAILVIAMLTIPAAIAGSFTHHLWKMMLLAIGFGLLLTFSGTFISYVCNWPPGATISLLAALLYSVSLVRTRLRHLA